MGKIFYNLTPDELCDLMCGAPEEEPEEESEEPTEGENEHGNRNIGNGKESSDRDRNPAAGGLKK